MKVMARKKKLVDAIKAERANDMTLAQDAEEREDRFRWTRGRLELDLTTLDLTDDEGTMLLLAVLKGNDGRGDQDDLQHQHEAIATWVRQTKRDVASINLALNGLVDLSVDAEGKIGFRASERVMRIVRPN